MDKYLETKFIYFSIYQWTGKTFVYNIYSKEGKFLLGQIKWYPSWRCYAFFPTENSVFEKTCLNDIKMFIEQLAYERKETKKKLNEIQNEQP